MPQRGAHQHQGYGGVLAHYAVRWLMHSAGSAHEVAPRRLSFVANVQLLKRAQPQSGAFPPQCARDCISAGLRRCWNKRLPCYASAAGVAPMAPLFTEIDALSEAADEREDDQALEILGALYDYAEMIAPEH